MQQRWIWPTILSSWLALTACTVTPMGTSIVGMSAPTPDEVEVASPAGGGVSLGLQLSALTDTGYSRDTSAGVATEVTVTLVRDDELLDQQTLTVASLARRRNRLSFDSIAPGLTEVHVRVYDQDGWLIGQGTTWVSVRDGRTVSKTLAVSPVAAGGDAWLPARPTPTPDPTPTPKSTPRPTPAPVATPAHWTGFADPNAFFISQMKDARWNPAAPDWTQNCGPTSLAMALKAYAVLPPGASSFVDSQQLIHLTRQAMTGNQDDYKLTSLEDLEAGASACGLSHFRVYGLSGVREAIARHDLVVVAGDPVAYDTRYPANQYSAFDGGHFVLVTGVDDTQVYVNDPLSRVGNLSVSTADFTRYMAYQGWNVGMAVSLPSLF